MRRLFIIRKDLNMSKGKLSAMIAHCSEAYFTNMIKHSQQIEEYDGEVKVIMCINKDILDNYINKDFTKIICEAKNLNHLLKVKEVANDLNLIEGIDYGFINDACLTELIPENEDGTCTIGVWFKPLPDKESHLLSKKYQLYKN